MMGAEELAESVAVEGATRAADMKSATSAGRLLMDKSATSASRDGGQAIKLSSSVNKAAWLCGVNDIRILPFELPEHLGPHDVRVRIKAVGICGSDVHYYRHLRCSSFVVRSPMVVGHESAGEVVAVGSDVSRCRPGDRVALEPGICCSLCSFCTTGRYNLCPKMEFFATPPVHGSLAQEIIHPEHLCFPLPPEVSLEEGAMCEPLSVAVHACRRAGDRLFHADVAVFGAGPIGLTTLMVAKAFGAAYVVVADVDDDRLAFAERMGADATVKMRVGEGEEEHNVAALSAAFSRRDSSSQCGSDRQFMEHGQRPEEHGHSLGEHGRPSVSFDCVGLEATMRSALRVTRSGGRVMLVGMAANEMRVPLTEAAAREVDVLGVFRYCNTYPLCIDLIHRKKVDVKPLITHRYGFSEEEVRQAFQHSARGGPAIKVMFIM